MNHLSLNPAWHTQLYDVQINRGSAMLAYVISNMETIWTFEEIVSVWSIRFCFTMSRLGNGPFHLSESISRHVQFRFQEIFSRPRFFIIIVNPGLSPKFAISSRKLEIDNGRVKTKPHLGNIKSLFPIPNNISGII